MENSSKKSYISVNSQITDIMTEVSCVDTIFLHTEAPGEITLFTRRGYLQRTDPKIMSLVDTYIKQGLNIIPTLSYAFESTVNMFQLYLESVYLTNDPLIIFYGALFITVLENRALLKYDSERFYELVSTECERIRYISENILTRKRYLRITEFLNTGISYAHPGNIDETLQILENILNIKIGILHNDIDVTESLCERYEKINIVQELVDSVYANDKYYKNKIGDVI